MNNKVLYGITNLLQQSTTLLEITNNSQSEPTNDERVLKAKVIKIHKAISELAKSSLDAYNDQLDEANDAFLDAFNVARSGGIASNSDEGIQGET